MQDDDLLPEDPPDNEQRFDQGRRLHDEVGFDNFWDTAHTKSISEFKSEADKEDWTFYLRLRSGGTVLQALHFERGDQCFAFGRNQDGSAGGDNLQILSPTKGLTNSCNAAGKSNDLSYVLRVRHARMSVLLPGDIEEEACDDLVSHYGAMLKSDFMRASHHGRDSGYHLEALRLIKAMAVVVSVGRKPDTDATAKYKGQCSNVYSTRYYGNLQLIIQDNGSYKWISERK